MPIQLSPEQEQRLEAVVARGAYATTQEALDAGVAAIEFASEPLPEDERQEIEALLLEGLESPVMSSEEFWAAVKADAAEIVTEHKASLRQQGLSLTK